MLESFDAIEGAAVAEGDFESPLLVWENVSLTQNAYPTLVSSMGFVEKGEMMAVLGSGAASGDVGALMDLLSGRPVRGEVGGYYAVDGRTTRRERLRDVCAFVSRGYEIPAHLTAFEAMFFLTRLRVAMDMDNFEVLERCKWAREEMGLDEVGEVFVGGRVDGCEGARFVRGLAPDQRRRLAVAAAIATKPRVLFLEDVTTGLDCASAMALLRRVGAPRVLPREAVEDVQHGPLRGVLRRRRVPLPPRLQPPPHGDDVAHGRLLPGLGQVPLVLLVLLPLRLRHDVPRAVPRRGHAHAGVGDDPGDLLPEHLLPRRGLRHQPRQDPL